ncbi:aminoacylase [Kordiimonas sediminis]|uniref:Aminoacylase n=1 Tax=Kordiimonas sediminis TaxID=1735581 RepID=A0A919E3X4_9PROT|nr:D-aminoacylase [Kordiimonas sediminis]GHF17208.1 aminoacylase [Kordiimonas sediminis]
MKKFFTLFVSAFLLWSCGSADTPETLEKYDVVIVGGTVMDGSGQAGRLADVAIQNDRVVKIGDLGAYEATLTVDASGQAVAPGFINMLSWAPFGLVTDGRAVSDLVQGVTLEVFGEGMSMGPLSDANKKMMQDRINTMPKPFEVSWTGFGEYLDFVTEKGVSPNVASFVGATTVRANVVGYEDRAATEDELVAMQMEVRTAMEEGALGVGSSLIYAPAFYANTEELIALNKAAAEYDGMYISHMRSEGNRFLESLDELITIAREAGVRAEVYHLKAAGQSNWPKMEQAIAKINAARAEGLAITADVYTYPAGATGLDAAMPPWVQAGGYQAWADRLKDPDVRAKVLAEMRTPTDEWENLMMAAGPDGVLLPYFQNPDLKKYTGMTLSAVAADMGVTPEEAAIDLVIADGTRVSAIYFLMSEENIRRQIKEPWVSFGSDADAMDPAIASQFGSTHPRGYGNFARVFAKYVREDGVISVEEAVRRLTHLPATNLKIRDRGLLAEGYYADVVVFDPATIQDHSTFENPHALSTGVSHVFVNGTQVVKDGTHTGATPGRVVRGAGWTGWKKADK